MSEMIFFWNIRGLGSSRGRLKKLLNKFKVKLFAIAEPFLNANRMHVLGNYLNMNYNFYISNEAQGGKLWLFWKDLMSFEVLVCSSQSISGWFMLDGKKNSGHFCLHKMFICGAKNFMAVNRGVAYG